MAALQIIGNTLYVGGAFRDGGNLPAADFLVACDLTYRGAHLDGRQGRRVQLRHHHPHLDSNGTLYAGGGFINLQGVVGIDHVAYLSGGTWHAMGGVGAVDDEVRSLTAVGTNVYVGTDASTSAASRTPTTSCVGTP